MGTEGGLNSGVLTVDRKIGEIDKPVEYRGPITLSEIVETCVTPLFLEDRRGVVPF